MAAAARLKLKQTPTDVWSNRERLCLASSVMRSGDQNWVSVSRAIKPFGEANRPADWFSQKNCALQYSDLLEKVETPKRKRGERGEIETPGESIVRKLTAERVEELKKLIQQEQEQYRKMKREIYLIQSGQLDDKLNDLWAAILEEKKKEEQAALNHQKWLKERDAAKEAALAAMRMNKVPPKKVPIKYPRLTSMRRNSSQSEQGSEPDSVADSPSSESLNIDTGVEEPQTPETPISQEIVTPTTPKPSPTTQPTPTSPLLSSLLKSPTTAATQANLSLLQSLESPGRSTSISSISTLLNASPTKPCLLNPPFSRSGDVENTPRPPTSSPSAGAPTLSKLLEMPLASPGKPLPPLPVITTEETHSKITEILSEALIKVEPVVTPSVVTPIVSSVVISETEKTSDKTMEVEESNMSIDSENVSLETTIPSQKEENVEESQKTECKTEKESEKPVPETKPLTVPSTEPLEEQTVKAEESTPDIETTIETVEVEQTESLVEKEVPSPNAEESEAQIEEKTEKLEEELVEEVEEVIIETVTEEIIEPAAMAAEVEVISEQEKEVTEATEDSEVSKDATESTAEQTSAPLPADDANEEKVEEKEVPPEEEKISEKPAVKEEIEESKTDIEECKSSPIPEDQTKQIKTNETVVDEEPKCDEKDETDEEKKTTTAVSDDVSVTSSPSTPVSHSAGRGRGGRRRGRKPGSGRGGHHNQQSELPVSETPPVQPSQHNKMGRGRRHTTQQPKEEKKEEKEEKKEEEPQKEETKEVKVKEKARSSRQSESNSDSQDKLPSVKADSVVSPKRIRGSREKEKRKVKEKKEKEKETPEETTKVQTKETEEKEENISTSAENSLMEADDKVSEKDESSNLSKPALCDSIPNSPASTAQSDDQESLRDYKVWKKAIMLVWRSAANHKYANVFLHPVTEEVAPGYHSVVYRPMDLSQIKKNIENGVIKTTTEFQRDMMLMFQDAIMYNNSDHDVFHMAVEMQKEVVRHIQDFLATQLMVQTAEIPKALRRETREHALKRTSESQSEKQPEETKKTPQTPDSDGPPKPKKRR